MGGSWLRLCQNAQLTLNLKTKRTKDMTGHNNNILYTLSIRLTAATPDLFIKVWSGLSIFKMEPPDWNFSEFTNKYMFKAIVTQEQAWNLVLDNEHKFFVYYSIPAGSHLFKVNNENTRAMCKIYSKLTTRRQNKNIDINLVSLLLALNKFRILL